MEKSNTAPTAPEFNTDKHELWEIYSGLRSAINNKKLGKTDLSAITVTINKIKAITAHPVDSDQGLWSIGCANYTILYYREDTDTNVWAYHQLITPTIDSAHVKFHIFSEELMTSPGRPTGGYAVLSTLSKDSPFMELNLDVYLDSRDCIK